MATGLYDPAYEHDACGVGMVADLHGRPDHDIVDRGLTVLERLAHRGASGAEVETGDGAGILVQMPAPLPGPRRPRRPASRCPRPGGYAVGMAFLPVDADDAAQGAGAVEQLAAEEGLGVLGWRVVPTEPAGSGGDRARAPCRRIEQVFLAPVDAGADDLMALERQAFVLRKRAEHAVDGSLLPVAVGPHPRLQGHAHLRAAAISSSPTCVTRRSSRAWPWSTPASRPTPSPAGRWPTRTATWPTTGRSTRWPATGTGCGPARRCSRRTLIPGDLARIYPVCTPGASDSASFDEVLELLHLGGPLAAPRGADDDPRGVGEPRHDGPGPARLLPLPRVPDGALGRPGRGRLHRRHGGRRGARPQRAAPGALLGDRRRAGGAGQRGGRARHRARAGRAQGPAPTRAACSWSTRPRAGWSRTRRSRRSWRPSTPTPSGWPRTRCASTSCRRRTMLTPQHGGVVTQQRLFGYTNEELRVILAPMARSGRRAARLDGLGRRHRGALGPLPAALRLLHPALRPGDQPAARRHPRGAGHLAVGHHRARGEPALGRPGLVPADPAAAARHRPRRPGQAHVRQRARRDAGLQGLRHRRALRGGRGRRPRAPPRPPGARRCAGPSTTCAAGCPRPSRTEPTSSCCRTATRPPSGRPSRRCC